MRRNYLVGIMVACVFVASSAAVFWRDRMASAEDADLLPALIQACKDSVTGIKSGKGTIRVKQITYEYDGNDQKALQTEETFKTAFDGAKYRISGDILYIRNEFETEHPITPGTELSYDQSFDGENLVRYDDRASTARVGVITNPELGQWHYSSAQMLIFPPSPLACGANGHGIRRIDVFPEPMDNIVDKGLRVARRDSVDGRDCIIVQHVRERTMADGHKRIYTIEYWIDFDRGVVPRTQQWLEDSTLPKRCLAGQEDVEFRDYGNGVFGPRKFIYESYAPDGKGGMRPLERRETTYESDFRLNVPVSADDLTIKLPSDAHVQVLDSGSSPQ